MFCFAFSSFSKDTREKFHVTGYYGENKTKIFDLLLVYFEIEIFVISGANTWLAVDMCLFLVVVFVVAVFMVFMNEKQEKMP